MPASKYYSCLEGTIALTQCSFSISTGIGRACDWSTGENSMMRCATALGRQLSSALEKALAPHSSTLAWKIPCTSEPGGLQSMASLRVGHVWVTSLSLSCIGEGNGNPLQYSCLVNLRDGGAWWVAAYGVAQSRTRLKRLSSSTGHWVLILSMNLRLDTPPVLGDSINAPALNTHLHAEYI